MNSLPKGAKERFLEGCKVVVGSGALIALGLLATGCGQRAPEVTSDSLPVLSLWYSQVQSDAVETTLTSIGAKTVNLTSRQWPLEQFEARAVDNIAADAAPDVWMIPNDWVPDHINKLVTIPNDFWVSEKEGEPKTTLDSFKANYYDWLVDDLTLVNFDIVPEVEVANAASTEIRFVGFPGPVRTLVLFKNQTLFAEAFSQWRRANQNASDEEENRVRQIMTKEIKSWSQLVDAVKLLRSVSGGVVNRAGIAMGTATNVEQADDIVQLLTYQQGGRIVNAVEKIALFDGFEKTADGRTIYPGHEALRFYAGFADPASDHYTWNTGLGSARKAFLDGRAAMLIDYPEFEDVIRQQEQRVNFTISPVPQLYEEQTPVNFAVYDVFAVTKAAADQQKAGAFAKAFTQSGTIKSVMRGLRGSVSPFFADNANSGDAVAQQAATARTVYKRHHTEFDAAFRAMIDDVALQRLPIEEAVKRTADIITRLLQSE